MYKVYLARLERGQLPGWPYCVYKIGITQFDNALIRLRYAGADEPNPIIKTFPITKIIKTITVENEDQALKIEAEIMKRTINWAKDKRFHNWYEPDQVSGITEMRKWDRAEVRYVTHLMNNTQLILEDKEVIFFKKEQLIMKQIFNIHNHSTFSIHDGVGTPDQWAKYISENPEQHVQAISLSEHGTLNGMMETFNAAKKYNLKYMPSVEIYLEDKYNFDNPRENQKGHLVLFGVNKRGYEQIIQINNLAIQRGQILKMRSGKRVTVVTLDILEEVIRDERGNVKCSGACVGGYWNLPILKNNDIRAAHENLIKIMEIFGKENTYIEYQVYLDDTDKQLRVNCANKIFKEKYDLKAIVTSDAHIIKKDDVKYQAVAVAMGWKTTLEQFLKVGHLHYSVWLKNSDEFFEALEIKEFGITEEDMSEAINETLNIFDELEEIELFQPQVFTYHNSTEEEKLQKFSDLVYSGWNEKIDGIIPVEERTQYMERLAYETKLLRKKNFIDYFLAVSEIVEEGRKQGIVFGVGRGSAASSLVSYLLNITNLDPIKYNLIFERFISEDRIDYPDIDVDCSNREDLINIIQSLYPNSDVTVVANKSKLGLKNLINYMFKVFNITYPKKDYVSSGYYFSDLVDKYNLDQYDVDSFMELAEVEDLEQHFNNKFPNYNLHYMFNLLIKNLSNIGIHAGGVCILPKGQSIVPLTPVANDKYAHGSGYSESGNYRELEYVGQIKFDFLGIRTLRIFEDVGKLLREKYDDWNLDRVNKLLEFEGVNVDDNMVYDRINTTLTDGFFQISSSGMKQLICDLKPSNIEELAQLIALYRPGPLQAGMNKTMKGVKNGEIKERSLWPEDLLSHLEPIIKNTSYHILYQEQLMHIGKAIGDYSIIDLNNFRNFLSKGNPMRESNPKKFAEWQKKFYDSFIENGAKKGISNKSLELLWEKMKQFSKYSFVKAHAVSYAHNAFMCAYLSQYYPIEWYTAMLRHEDPIEFLPIVKEQIEQLGLEIQIIPPQINNIYRESTNINNKVIILGINQIKGIGVRASEELNNIANIHYDNFQEFLTSKDYSKRVINKGIVEKLIKIGFFNTIEPDRAKLLIKYMKSIVKLKKGEKPPEINRSNFLSKLYNFNASEDLFFFKAEMSMIGTSLTSFPYQALANQVDAMVRDDVRKYARGEEIYLEVLAGIDSIKIKQTKTKKEFLSLKLRTISGKFIWCNLFDSKMKHIEEQWQLNLKNEDYSDTILMFYYTESGSWKNLLDLVPLQKFIEVKEQVDKNGKD